MSDTVKGIVKVKEVDKRTPSGWFHFIGSTPNGSRVECYAANLGVAKSDLVRKNSWIEVTGRLEKGTGFLYIKAIDKVPRSINLKLAKYQTLYAANFAKGMLKGIKKELSK